MDYLTDIKPLRDQGFSDADIVLHINAKTTRPMQQEESRYILQDTGAVLTDPVSPDQRTGSLISYYQGLPDGDAKKLIAFFISRIYNGEVVRTDQWPRSAQFKGVEDSMPAELQAVSAELVRSAGGRAASVTEADLTAAQQAWEDQEAQRLAQEEANLEAAREEALRMEDLVVEWGDRPYTRAQGCFPPGAFRVDKYWPPVNRVDNVHGDRNLICTCPPLEDYAEAAE